MSEEFNETSKRIDPRQKDGFSLQDDILVTWIFLTNQYTDFMKYQSTYLNRFKSLGSAYNRFIEIIKTPELVDKMRKELKEDIFGYKSIPFSKFESIYLYKIVSSLNITDGTDLLLKYSQYFNPSRTPTYIQQKMKNLEGKDDQFESFMDEVRKNILEIPLSDFPGNQDNLSERINEVLDNIANNKDKNTEKFGIEQILENSKTNFEKNTLAILVGQDKNYPINKTTTIIGRKSPKTNCDIDISSIHEISSKVSRNHCKLTLSTDFEFYIHVDGNFILVNGILIKKGETVHLKDYDVLDIGSRLFIFYKNPEIFG